MRAEPGTPVMRLQAGCLTHFAIHPGINFRAWWPVAFIESGNDQPVSALHAGFNRPKNGKTRMRLPAAPDGLALHQAFQNLRKGPVIRFEHIPLDNQCPQQISRSPAIIAIPDGGCPVRLVNAAIILQPARCHAFGRTPKTG